MRTTFVGLSLFAIVAAAAPALAQDAPASDFTLTGGATMVSDYRFRGISQTNKRFAIQGTFGISHSSGFYLSAWGSSIDDYVANGSDQEIDLIGGWKKAFDGTTVDVGVLYYYYPGSGGINSDFFEPYASVSHTFGPIGVKVGGNFAWKQHALSYGAGAKEGGAYLYGELSAAIPDTGFTITGHAAHSFTKNYITFGEKYSDVSVTAAYTWKNLTASVAYVDTTRATFTSGTRNVGSSGVVGAIGVAF